MVVSHRASRLSTGGCESCRAGEHRAGGCESAGSCEHRAGGCGSARAGEHRAGGCESVNSKKDDIHLLVCYPYSNMKTSCAVAMMNQWLLQVKHCLGLFQWLIG